RSTRVCSQVYPRIAEAVLGFPIDGDMCLAAVRYVMPDVLVGGRAEVELVRRSPPRDQRRERSPVRGLPDQCGRIVRDVDEPGGVRVVELQDVTIRRDGRRLRPAPT